MNAPGQARILLAVFTPRLLALVATAALAGVSAGPAQAARTPRVDISVGETIRDSKKQRARMTVTADRGGYSGFVGIEERGNAGPEIPKRSYSVETRTRDGDNRTVELLGFPAENDFILEAVHTDETYMRNALAYRTARRLGRWGARTDFVEVWVNGRYRGLYVLTEQVKLDRNRMDVDRRGVSGGYLLELTDGDVEGDITGPVSGRPYEHKDPEGSDLDGEEEDYIEGFVARAEQALVRDDASWRAFLDMDAAVDYVLLNELFKNNDNFNRSVFLAKGWKEPFVLGPIWDFDRSLGDEHLLERSGPEGWVTPGRLIGATLLRDPVFVDKLIARWRELREERGMRGDLLRAIDANAREVRWAQIRDSRLWTQEGEPDHETAVRDMKAWLIARTAWVDANIEGLRAGARPPP